MSPFRSRRRHRRSAFLFFSLCLVLLGGCRQTGTNTKEPSMSQSPSIVEAGTAPDRTLSGGESHEWSWTVPAGHMASLEVKQLGIDVVVCLFQPSATEAELEVDGLGGATGVERLSACPEVETEYRLVISALSSQAPEGQYRLTATASQPASPGDCLVAQAERRFDAGERQRRLETDEGRQASLPFYIEAQDLYGQAGNAQGELACLQRRAWMHEELSERDEARSLNLQLIDLALTLGEDEERGNALNRLGNLDMDERNLAAARVRFEEARDLGLAKNLVPLEVTSLNNLALLLYHQEDMGGATQGLQEVAQRWQALGRPLDQALALYNLGLTLQAQGEYPGAVDALEQARDLREEGADRPGTAKALLRLAAVRYQMEDFPAAEQAFEDAIALGADGLPKHERVATANDLALLYRQTGRLEEAGESFEEARNLAQELGLPFPEAMTLLNFAALRQYEGRHQESLDLLAQARTIFTALGDQRHLAACDLLEGQTLVAQGSKHQALAKLEQAAKGVEDVRLRHSGWGLRMSFFSTRQAYYDELIGLLMDLHGEADAKAAAGSLSEAASESLGPALHSFAAGPDSSRFAEGALMASERRRARSLLDALAEAPLGYWGDGSLTARESRLTEELAEVSRELDSGATLDPEGLRRRRRQLLQDLELTRTKIRQSSPLYADLTRPEPLSVEEMREQVLDAETRLLVYSLGEEQSFLFTLTRSTPLRAFPLPGRQRIETMVEAAVEALQDEDPRHQERNRHILENLSDLLLGPLVSPALADEGGAEMIRLAIVADGALQTLPFAALPVPVAEGEADGEPRPWLLELQEVIHLPSASTLAALRQEIRNRPRARFPIAIFADPVFSAGDERMTRPPIQGEPHGAVSAARRAFGKELVRLPETAKEAQAIAELMGPDHSLLALSFEASRDTFKGTALEDYAILHFATHGVLDPVHPELSGFALSMVDEDGQPVDGFIRAHELYSRRFGADLAVLSACSTGLGRQVAGEGIVGLPRGFFYAGVPRVIVSLWNVADDSTAALMTEMYTQMDFGLAPSTALRKAQLTLLQGSNARHRHPRFWAPFVFLGEWLSLEETSGDGGGFGQGGSGGGSLDPPAKGLAYDQEGAPIPLPAPPSSLLRAVPEAPDGREPASTPPPAGLVNGVDGETGRLLSPEPDLPAEALKVGPREYRRIANWAQNRDRLRLPVYGVDPEALDEAGWAVIYAPGVTDEEREALDPLVNRRRRQVRHQELFQEIEYDAGSEKEALAFLEKRGVAFGRAVPKKLPYYVLLVGDPNEISFRFQYELDVQYAVGRLHLSSPDDYAAYAQAVKKAEQSQDVARPAVFWGTEVEGDESSQWLMRDFVRPLAQAADRWRKTQKRSLYDTYLAADGRHGTLANLLGRETPAFLFTGSHGVTYGLASGLQEKFQGSLICEEWQPSEGPVPRDAFFAADDLPEKTDLEGLILFNYACYSSGCASRDPFEKDRLGRARRQAQGSFVSALSQRLLARGAQAVLGHVDRAWPDTFTWKEQGDQTRSFVSFLHQLLEGRRLGHATEDLNTRYAEYGSHLTRLLDQEPHPGTDSAKLRDKLRQATLDARGYVIIGDPAVRLVGTGARRTLA